MPDSVVIGVRKSGEHELLRETVELAKVNEIESKTVSNASQEDIAVLRNSYIRQRQNLQIEELPVIDIKSEK